MHAWVRGCVQTTWTEFWAILTHLCKHFYLIAFIKCCGHLSNPLICPRGLYTSPYDGEFCQIHPCLGEAKVNKVSTWKLTVLHTSQELKNYIVKFVKFLTTNTNYFLFEKSVKEHMK